MAFQVFKFYFNLKKILNTCLKTAYGKQLVSSFREEGMKKFGLEHYKKFNGAPIDVLEDLVLSQHSGNLCRELLERVGHKIIFISLQAVHAVHLFKLKHWPDIFGLWLH